MVKNCRDHSMPFKVLLDTKYFQELKIRDNESALCITNDFENGKWRLSNFTHYIWDNIHLAALNSGERKALVDNSRTKLTQCALNLRFTNSPDSPTESSEIAEILLYAIMRDYYKGLVVVPKIYYKQNVNDNAKGADSVHIVLKDDGKDFDLWLGETKFFNSNSNNRYADIIDSLTHLLSCEKLRKEEALILGYGELHALTTDGSISQELFSKISTLLSTFTSLDELKPKLHVPILILHECAITKSASIFDETYKNKMHLRFLDRIKALFKKHYNGLMGISLYNAIHFHLILFPIPNKSELAQNFRTETMFYRKTI